MKRTLQLLERRTIFTAVTVSILSYFAIVIKVIKSTNFFFFFKNELIVSLETAHLMTHVFFITF